MIFRKFVHILFSMLIVTSFIGSNINVSAAPTSPTDESKVPHYFGPNSNYANSPFAMPDAQVVITGNGSGATAVATVGAGGSITAITVTDGGFGYTNAKVDITGSGTGASADVVIVKKGAVVDVTVTNGGTGYTAPLVTITGNGTGALASAFGGVEQVTVRDGGSGYTMPVVDFDLPDDPNGVQVKGHAEMDTNGTITAVVIDSPGSGYATAPGVSILNGTHFDPIPLNQGGSYAKAATTLTISSIVIDNGGSSYSKVDVTISDPTGTGATALATLDNGVITAINVKKPGSGYIAPGGIQKFVDTLPGLGPAGANNLGQYLPVAVPDTTTFPGTDYYVIALVQHREQMHSDLPPTLLREYVQLSTSVVPGINVALQTDQLDGTLTPTLMPDGTQAYGVDNPHYLGPLIVAQKDRAVRITFYNLLPTGEGGNLFLPVDSTFMGSGEGQMMMGYDPTPTTGGDVMDTARNPMCSEGGAKDPNCFTDNRATLHLHGGITPWISDGTPHQWITPANESTAWPEGVTVQSVPDMVGQAATDKGIPDCSNPDDGCMTFYYTNQQSARLMFYHDHAWGITPLNVYAGEAAGYIIHDDTEQALISSGLLPSGPQEVPLVIQDKTFVPQDAQLYNDPANGVYGQDPTWDASRWGGYGNLWYEHVYMPAQNPNDPSGMKPTAVGCMARGFGRLKMTSSTGRSTTLTTIRTATWTTHPPGSTRSTHSASLRSSPARLTFPPVWSSSTTRR